MAQIWAAGLEINEVQVTFALLTLELPPWNSIRRPNSPTLHPRPVLHRHKDPKVPLARPLHKKRVKKKRRLRGSLLPTIQRWTSTDNLICPIRQDFILTLRITNEIRQLHISMYEVWRSRTIIWSMSFWVTGVVTWIISLDGTLGTGSLQYSKNPKWIQEIESAGVSITTTCWLETPKDSFLNSSFGIDGCTTRVLNAKLCLGWKDQIVPERSNMRPFHHLRNWFRRRSGRRVKLTSETENQICNANLFHSDSFQMEIDAQHHRNAGPYMFHIVCKNTALQIYSNVWFYKKQILTKTVAFEIK